jgi:hypothetical protein
MKRYEEWLEKYKHKNRHNFKLTMIYKLEAGWKIPWLPTFWHFQNDGSQMYTLCYTRKLVIRALPYPKISTWNRKEFYPFYYHKFEKFIRFFRIVTIQWRNKIIRVGFGFRKLPDNYYDKPKTVYNLFKGKLLIEIDRGKVKTEYRYCQT